MRILLCQHGRRMLWNHVIFFFEDRMNHLESQQKYDKKRLSTHTGAFGRNGKVYLRNDD